MAWITPVTGRKSDRIKMTHDDMNRISGNCQYLLNALSAVGLLGDAEVKTSWINDEIIYLPDWQKIVRKTNSIKTQLEISTDSVAIDFSYENINQIETIHALAKAVMTPAADSFYSGEGYSGEGVIF